MRQEQKKVEVFNNPITTFHYHPQIVSCQVNEQEVISQLSDGRKMSIPLD
jgi:hypothetical protein